MGTNTKLKAWPKGKLTHHTTNMVHRLQFPVIASR